MSNNMTEYHVSTGAFGIYAGRINKKGDKWLEKSEVTDEVLFAAANYLCREAETNNRDTWGYEWDTKDGRIIELIVKIRNKDKENNNE